MSGHEKGRILGDWTVVDCGCCFGIQWGGEEPRTCRRCQGSGGLWLSPSGTRLALYPGGPFAGVAHEVDRKQAAELRAAEGGAP